MGEAALFVRELSLFDHGEHGLDEPLLLVVIAYDLEVEGLGVEENFQNLSHGSFSMDGQSMFFEVDADISADSSGSRAW